MVNLGPQAADIVSLVWGTLANFNGFRVLASLLQQSRSTEANQTLHYVWPSPALARYIYVFRGSCLRAAITLGIGPHSSFISFHDGTTPEIKKNRTVDRWRRLGSAIL